ncbi:MAG: TetR/AcrR family transcriptional regulator [Desulfovibrio sp.]
MAKAKYDRDDVINRSIELFWKNGYSGSSMKDVVKTTGLKPGSLYLSFGNKEAIYRESLQRYADNSIALIRDVLDNAESVGEGICQILKAKIEMTATEQYRSCFLVKTQHELAFADSDLHDFAAAKLGEIERLYCSYLEKEFSTELSRARAASIMLHIFGLGVYGYQNRSPEKILRVFQVGLPWLPWAD